MSDSTYRAIAILFGAVIVVYTIRDQHTRYLADLLALALALAAPRYEYAVGAVAILAIVRHTALANGLVELVPWWSVSLLLPGAIHMSSDESASAGASTAPESTVSAPDSTAQNIEIQRSVAEKPDENIYLLQTEALARLVIAGKIGRTDAVKIGAGAKSGAKYQRKAAELTAAIERLENHYPPASTLTRFD